MSRLLFLVCLCHMFTIIVTAPSQHMICKNVDGVFAEDENDLIPSRGSAHSRSFQSLPGKRGPKGERGGIGMHGVKGQQGESGIVDYQKVNATVEQLFEKFVQKSVASRIEELEERMLTKLDEAVQKLDEKIDEIDTILLGSCDGVSYLGKCYIASLHTAYDVNYDQAVAMCGERSGKPADIIDSQHYDLVLKYIRSLMSSSYASIWLAMTYVHQTKKALLSSGTTAPYTNYYPGNPSSSASYTGMEIGVRNPSSSSQGMFNYARSYTRHGVLCQKERFTPN
uniref:mannose-binding protein-like n=1 Tax=Styela clava TaxID=7725 RepID=UPI00193A88E0|nr:mannose-binding protein-like [Styela clava]